MMLYFTLVRTRKNSEYRDLLGADSPEEALEMLLSKRSLIEDEVAYADVHPFTLEDGNYGN